MFKAKWHMPILKLNRQTEELTREKKNELQELIWQRERTQLAVVHSRHSYNNFFYFFLKTNIRSPSIEFWATFAFWWNQKKKKVQKGIYLPSFLFRFSFKFKAGFHFSLRNCLHVLHFFSVIFVCGVKWYAF